mgnify:CR=1 FL=1|jgi:histidinol-phosphate phosphatase family protein
MTLKIDKNWTLFLDRDGVINERLPGDYVKSIEQFKFTEGCLEALAMFARFFHPIIIVTNQQGVGKGLMSLEELENIHNYLISEVSKAGGRIDKIYVSPYLQSERHFTRKPSVGMGIAARKQFKDINFRKSIMAGDSYSDMLFGKRLGMKTVFIGNTEDARKMGTLADYCYPDLFALANALKNCSQIS